MIYHPPLKKKFYHPIILPHVLPQLICLLLGMGLIFASCFSSFHLTQTSSRVHFGGSQHPPSWLAVWGIYFNSLLLGMTLRWFDFLFLPSVLPQMGVSQVVKVRGRSWRLPFFLPLSLFSKAHGCSRQGESFWFFPLTVVPSFPTVLWASVILESKTSWHVPPYLPRGSLLFIADGFSESCPSAFSYF